MARRQYNKDEIEDGHVVDLIPCFNCGGRCKKKKAHNGLYCGRCWETYAQAGEPMSHSLKCGVPGCVNRTDQGEFVGIFCAPCHSYIVGTRAGGEKSPSQAYFNELVKNNLRAISAVDERCRHIMSLSSSGGPALVVHEGLEDLRILMTAVLSDHVDLFEKWNKDLFVAREHALRVECHRQKFRSPR
jgi:hypothetical protein